MLHMINTGDPLRDSLTFTFFGDPDYFFLPDAPNCSSPMRAFQNSGNSWNHGGIQPEIMQHLVGPRRSRSEKSRRGQRRLVGPHRYSSDDAGARRFEGRLPARRAHADRSSRAVGLAEQLDLVMPAKSSSSWRRRSNRSTHPTPRWGRTSLRISTKALAGSDSTYSKLEGKLSGIMATTVRDLLAGQMLELLEDAEFNNSKVSASTADTLVKQAGQLLDYVNELGDN